MCKAKAVSNYPVSIMSNQEVTRHGYDEAVLMDTQGYVCQGSGENLFWSKMVSCIPQICQGVHWRHYPSYGDTVWDLGIKVHERRITRDEFYIADEIFMTGTAAEITPIHEYDDHVIGCGAWWNHRKLQSLFFDVVQGKMINTRMAQLRGWIIGKIVATWK